MKLCEINPSLCVFHKLNNQKVNKYKEMMQNGDIFPPIEVLFYQGRYIVKDGNHRAMASLLNNDTVWAYVFDIKDFDDSLWLLGSRINKKI